MRDGKEIRSNGYSSSGKIKTFKFRGIKNGDTVKMVYWKTVKTKTVKLYK